MKRLFIYFIIGCLVLLVLSGVVSASDTSDALYAGIIKVTNNGTAVTGVATTISGINTTSLIADGFLHSSANDSAILRSGSDVAFMPGYGTNPWILYVDSIGAGSTFNDIFYTPNVPDGKESYFPGTAGMTTTDHASIELGDNFTVTLSNVRIDTTAGAGKNIFIKNSAIDCSVSAVTDGTISVTIPQLNKTETLVLDGTGSLTQIPTVFGAATHWQACLTNDDATSYVEQNGAHYDTDLFTVQDSTISNGTIDSVTVYFRIYENKGKAAIHTHSTTYYGSEKSPAGTWTTYNEVWVTNPNTSAAWTWQEVNDMEAGVALYWNGGGNARCTWVYAVVSYHYDAVTATLTGISSGEHDIIISADTTNLELDIDGVSDSSALNGTSVPDNANNIISFENDTVLYAGSQEIEIDGVQKQFVDWDYGTTFTDQSGNNNHASPTFRTTSSDADVSANLTDFYPISEATAPAYAVSDAEAFISGAPNITGNFTTSINPSFPGSGIIEDTATSGGTPVQMPFIWLGCLGLLAVSFVTSSVATHFKSNSILPKILIVGILAAALVGLKVFDFWMLLYLIIPLLAFAVAKTHTTWGGESGYNMAGFLAMSFVGMTIINRIMEGAFLSSTDVSILNNVLVFRPVNVFGLFQISVPNMSFLTQGLPHLIRWDYSFFGGNAVIIQYLFYSITAFMAFLLFIIMLGVVFNMLSRSR